MRSYLSLLRYVLERGEPREDRTGVGTLSLFSPLELEHDMASGFPLLTTKSVNFRALAHEMMWMLRGENHVRFLRENGVRIWDKWAGEDGHVGPVYGVQWRNFNGQGIDQLLGVQRSLLSDPWSRRHIITSWNPAQTRLMALPPCPMTLQFYVRKDSTGRVLDLKVWCRSTDIFIGLPFDLAGHALLLHMMANETLYRPGRLVMSFGDLHLYRNHKEQAAEQLRRQPRPLPALRMRRPGQGAETVGYEDIILDGYDPHPAIKADVAA